MKIWVLNHVYIYNDGYEEIKFIGVYDSEVKAVEVITKLKALDRFKWRRCKYYI